MRHGRRILIACAAGAFLAAAPAWAQSGNSDAGSGLSPSAAATGNDRSAGVNNGNYRPPGGYGTRRYLRSAHGRTRRIAPRPPRAY